MKYESTYDLSSMLQSNNTLEVLDLSSNFQATTKGALLLFHSLDNNKGLKKIYLNNIVVTE